MNSESNIFIGIDVSKETLDISIDSKHFKIKNNTKAISDFIKSKIVLVKIAPKLVCLESTGGYETLALQGFQEASIPIHRAHPNKIYAFAKASGHFAKTDKLDAKLLEKYASFVSQEEKGDIAISKATSELQSLRSVERNLEDDLHATQCRLEHLNGRSVMYLKKQITFIKKQLDSIRQDIETAINSDESLKKQFKILKSYKGVGNKIASILLAELPELGKINQKEIASLVGVVPKLFHSGKKTPNGHIAGGRFYVRKAIYMAALVATRYNDKIKTYYEKLIKAGKLKKVALTAVMRKIIVCLNAMIKNNQNYA